VPIPPEAGFELIVDGVDYSGTIVPRLTNLTLTEKLAGEADTLEFTLSNHDGKIAPIARKVEATLKLGWSKGDGVKTGLVDKGRFIVDEVTKDGAPDTVTIRAHSADLTGTYRKRKDRSWKDTTLAAVLQEIAGDNGLTARVDATLGAIALPSIEQAAKSDMAFVRDLGARFDAIATVKYKVLIFLPIGAAANAGGVEFGESTVTRSGTGKWRFTIADREDHDGAEAKWHDKGAAKKKVAKSGGEKNPKRIKRNFASEAEAQAAADAEARKAKRGAYEFTYDMATGDPGIEPNRRVTLEGWDSEIDGVKWLVDEARHTLDGRGGLTSAIRLVSVET